MDTVSLPRRRLLAGAGAALASSVAGCSFLGGTRYTLKSRPDGGSSLVDLFTWRPASNAFHYDEAAVEGLAARLRESGTVESIEIPLVEERGTGEAGYRPSYTRHDGTYYRVRVQSDPVTLERWVVWMEPLDALPEGVEFTTEPESGLSEFDATIVRRAQHEATSSVVGDRDHAAQRAYRRGVVFFEPLDPADSELVPEPPFEYARVESDSHVAPDELAFRLHVETEAVETTRYTHELEPVATSRNEFESHVENEHVAAAYDGDAISLETGRVLDRSTALTGYDEEEPLSDAYEGILVDLDAADVGLPDDRDVASWLRYYTYDGEYYGATVRLSDVSIL